MLQTVRKVPWIKDTAILTPLKQKTMPELHRNHWCHHLQQPHPAKYPVKKKKEDAVKHWIDIEERREHKKTKGN